LVTGARAVHVLGGSMYRPARSDANVHVYTFSEGCEEVERIVAFRDHLE
jgi:hypothetical protein